jgi:hypothetical protein
MYDVKHSIKPNELALDVWVIYVQEEIGDIQINLWSDLLFRRRGNTRASSITASIQTHTRLDIFSDTR